MASVFLDESEDPLDQKDFDVTDFLNAAFPDEQSLEEIDSFVSKISLQRASLQTTLSQTVQEQAKYGMHMAQIDSIKAKESVQSLFERIKEIKKQAKQSESMVEEICRDIKQLDYAKRHLQTTITTMKRLSMLVTAVDQLERTAGERKFQEAAKLIEAVKLLFSHFEMYLQVEKIAELKNVVSSVQSELTQQVMEDFSAVGDWTQEENSSKSMLQALSSSSLVADALGSEVIKTLINQFCSEQLQGYDRTFGVGEEAFELECVERRFPWYYRFIRQMNEKCELVFPAYWEMSLRLTVAFCEKTRDHLLACLGQKELDEIDVTLLLKALQSTLAFEKDLEQRYRENTKSSLQTSTKNLEPILHLKGLISSTFDPFMTCYVALEKRNMEEMIVQVMATERVDRDGPLPVFCSSVNMFVYFRNAVKRCTALTNGQTFFSLQNEFKNCLRDYAKRLNDRVNLNVESSKNSTVGVSRTPLSPSAKQSSSEVTLPEEELCFVVNTCEYCAETLPSLTEAIATKIDVAYTDAISMDNEADVFHDVAAYTMKCLVSVLESKLEPFLTMMSKKPWSSWDNVGDQSDYVLQIGQVIESYIPTVSQMLPDVYFSSFCDKFAASFLPKHLNYIFKARRISDTGAQQLLLDTHALKTTMLKMPQAASSEKLSAPRYAKLVSKTFERTEIALKLVGTKSEMLVKNFKIMWPDGTAEDFQQIMSVKGLRKSEQQSLLEHLGLQLNTSRLSNLTTGVLSAEGKMSDMTQNFRKFAKSQRFGFGSSSKE